jgi:hypothetical protein
MMWYGIAPPPLALALAVAVRVIDEKPNSLAKNVLTLVVSFTWTALHPGLEAHAETVLKRMQGGMFRLEAELPVTQA